MARKHRLDAELVERGLFDTTDEAMRAVLAGEISGRGRRFSSPGEQVEPGVFVHVRGARIPYVSRGGLKLEKALDVFGVDPSGLTCLDVGCSTGGFTDCLLRRGAARVVAVDVGYAQFSWELRQDTRVELLERTNVCEMPDGAYDGRFDLVACDVSFTSVATILPAVMLLMKAKSTFVTLVKPQFEAARADVGSGGIVRDEAVRLQVLSSVCETLVGSGLSLLGTCESPVRGAKGNVEYLVAAVRPPASSGSPVS